MSPLIHNSLSEYLGINNVYVPFHVKSEGLEEAVKGAYELNILGLNATVPHKNQVMEYLVDIDDSGKGIGAVNTLVRCDGGYKGYNTDMMGLSRELASYGVELHNKNVIILGAGGAAKAVAYMCMSQGASRIYILNRTLSKAEDIANHMNRHFGDDRMVAMNIKDYGRLADYIHLADSSDEEKYIVFQSTSIGLYPHNDDVVIEDQEFYDMVQVGIDLIYKPFETRFMTLCKAAGVKAYNGLKMLLYQGIIAYELWNDIQVSEDIADKIYGKLLKKTRDNIILTGFMGSGKTTIGMELADRYGYSFLDTDKYIEDTYGCTIAQMFETHGEDYFRNVETETLKKLNATLSHTVISTGGGLPLRTENAEELSKLGEIIYLRITPEEVIARLAGDGTRPLLQCDNPEARIRELLSYRNPLYEKCADVIIDVSGKSVEKILTYLSNKFILTI
jgi:shikimate dehydrogenase